MAISHIPRSVGHNFAPEYQISSVPYIVDSSNTRNFKLVKRTADSTIVGFSDTATGKVTILEDPNLDLTTVFNDDSGNGTIEDAEMTADNILGAYELVDKPVIELPKISRWIQFLPLPNNSIKVAFSRKDIAEGRFIDFQSDSYPLEIRCTNLYFDAAPSGKILVGLTSIDRSEFTEVVETFLGDNK